MIRARFVAAALTFVAVAACSLAIDSQRQQCSTDADCMRASSTITVCSAGLCTAPALPPVEEAGPADPVWGCVGKTSPVPVQPEQPVRYEWRFIGPLSNQPLAGVKFRACGSLDFACSSPVPGTDGETDGEGVMRLTVSKGFRGYVDLTGPPGSSLMPTLFALRPPDGDVIGNKVETQAPIFATGEWSFLVQSLGETAKPEYGHLLGLAVDCGGVQPAAGVVLETTKVTADTARYYSDDNRVPSLELVSTTVRGEAGFFNLPPGAVTLNYFRNGAVLGSITVIIRPGAITLATLYPM